MYRILIIEDDCAIAETMQRKIALWGYEVRQGTVLYLALEDNHRRLQERLYRMFGVESTGNLFFAIGAKQLGGGLEEQLKALKESDGYLFEGDKPAPEIVKPGSPIRRTPAGGGDLDDFYANNPFYKKKA